MTALARLAVPLYALATVGLWFVARPYGDDPLEARLGLRARRGRDRAADEPGDLAPLGAASPVRRACLADARALGARTTDPSFPSDHAAAAFAIAFAVLAFSGRAGALFPLRRDPDRALAHRARPPLPERRPRRPAGRPRRCHARDPARDALDRPARRTQSAGSPTRCCAPSGTACADAPPSRT